MKTLQIFLFTLLSASVSFAQETDGNKLLHFGSSFAPKIGWFFSDDSDRADNQTEFAWSLYGNVYYDINHKFQLRSGLGFHSFTNSNRDYSPNFGCDHDGNGGYDPFNSYYEYVVQSYYLGIPLEGRLKLVGQANHLYWKFGAELLLKLWNKDNVEVHECGTHSFNLSDENFLYKTRKNIILLQTGLGYEWKISKTKFFAEPMLSYTPSKIFENIGTTGNLIANGKILQAGLLLGIIF